ncbi:hypothetical protein HPP92_007433 [Vanilla planifolia]|uniref:ATPase AAA-type core domain-containing protein n=1 Tax=Vanilla planifolia TaxID=51239 RepID=A0A835VB88_VANPL|nr:hypothetical protein HPP92_007433 [Vanilla planifolia]
MNQHGKWILIVLHLPSTFETLAMEPNLKTTIMEDLVRIVAMANYLRFDIYNLDLKEVRDNSGFNKLLAGMANQSLLVIEDMDRSINL